MLPQQPLWHPPVDDVEYQLAPAVDDEVTIVEPSVEGVEVINCSDIESYDSKRHFLGDSNDSMVYSHSGQIPQCCKEGFICGCYHFKAGVGLVDKSQDMKVQEGSRVKRGHA